MARSRRPGDGNSSTANPSFSRGGATSCASSACTACGGVSVRDCRDRVAPAGREYGVLIADSERERQAEMTVG
jgi:hypothetical protein